ncbi:MAG: ImmA/IrrE family metallo-endopeptidase [Clostridia bacterium]|nr:ImmA/IrrE family metallo-endopeptidase [Clostridia bacterium]
MRFEHKCARNFVKKYELTEISSESLIASLEKMGYTLIEYSKITNQPDVETLLSATGLKAFSLGVRAFYYHDKNMRLVFVEENLSDDERLLLLSHEIGHIMCDDAHSGKDRADIYRERSASEFSHYLLGGSVPIKLNLFLRRNKSAVAVAAAALFLVLCASVAAAVLNDSAEMNEQSAPVSVQKQVHTDSQEEIFYVTEHGKKYHSDDCSYAGNGELYEITFEECQRLGYEPCKICIGE